MPGVDYLGLSVEDLVRACAQTGEPAAWEEFVRRFHRLIATVAFPGTGRGLPGVGVLLTLKNATVDGSGGQDFAGATTDGDCSNNVP